MNNGNIVTGTTSGIIVNETSEGFPPIGTEQEACMLNEDPTERQVIEEMCEQEGVSKKTAEQIAGIYTSAAFSDVKQAILSNSSLLGALKDILKSPEEDVSEKFKALLAHTACQKRKLIAPVTNVLDAWIKAENAMNTEALGGEYNPEEAKKTVKATLGRLLKRIITFIMGLISFALDTALISLCFVGRISGGVILEAAHAGKAIGRSFNSNVLGGIRGRL